MLDELDLSMYASANVIEMNPGNCLWSAALHRRLKPRHHTLLEPRQEYYGDLNAFTKQNPAAYHVKLNGYDWATYNALFSGSHSKRYFPLNFVPPKIAKIPWEDGVNNDLLFTGNVTVPAEGDRLIAQFLSCCALESWVQQFGRVRFLVWVHETITARYLPTLIQFRARMNAMAEAVCEIKPVAEVKLSRTGRGFSRTVEQLGIDNVVNKARELGVSDFESVETLSNNEPYRDSKTGKILKRQPFLEPRKKKAKEPRKMKVDPVALKLNFKDPEKARWLDGMEHPPWYYKDDSSAVARIINAPKSAPSNLTHVINLLEAPLPQLKYESETEAQQMRDFFDKYEATYPNTTNNADLLRMRNRIDEVFALVQDPPMLQHARQIKPPLDIDPGAHLYPSAPVALLEFTPILPDPFFRAPDGYSRTQNWETFAWLVKNLFVLRATGIGDALRTIAPGADDVLQDTVLPDGKRVDARKRVRTLNVDELIAITKAWKSWPFKPEGIELEA